MTFADDQLLTSPLIPLGKTALSIARIHALPKVHCSRVPNKQFLLLLPSPQDKLEAETRLDESCTLRATNTNNATL